MGKTGWWAMVGTAIIGAMMFGCGDDADSAPGAAGGEDGGATTSNPTATETDADQTSGTSGGGGDPNAPTERVFSSDRSTFFGEDRCADLGALFCDDFESDAVGSAPAGAGWVIDAIAGGTLTVTDEDAGRGGRALRAESDQDFSRAWARQESIFPRDQFYGRLLFRVVAPGASDFVHWDLVEAIGRDTDDAPLKRMRFGGVSLRNDQGTDWIFNRFFFNFEMSPRP
ncbi:MAG: hypothetical protein AAGA56_18960, partial [Myxococcota bacterium]